MSEASNAKIAKLVKAVNREQLNKVFSIRYWAYKEINAIEADPSGVLFDEYDNEPMSSSYLYMKDELVIGSIRASLYSQRTHWEAIPAFDTYGEDIERELGKKKTILESNRFVIDPLFQASFSRHSLQLMKAIFLNTKIFKPEYVITSVRLEHAAFYQKLFNFKIISPVRNYAGLRSLCGVLLAVKGDEVEKACDAIKALRLTSRQIEVYLKTNILYEEASLVDEALCESV